MAKKITADPITRTVCGCSHGCDTPVSPDAAHDVLANDELRQMCGPCRADHTPVAPSGVPQIIQATTPPQLDATGDFVAPAERRRRAIKEPAQQEPVTIGARRCKGSVTFGIEAHDAPLADFPVQPSRPDGLGTMCKTHWREYTNALRKAALARKEPGYQPVGIDPGAKHAEATITKRDQAKQDRAVASERIANEARKGRAKREAARKAPTVDPVLAAAARLVQDVDALPADEYVKRVGQDDVQAALAIVAKGSGPEVAPLMPGDLGDGHAE